MTEREMLRHTLATLAYRGGKAVRGAPDRFGDFKTEAAIRTPGQVLAHVGDLLDWALELADGRHTWHDSAPRPWTEEVARFFDGARAARRPARLGGPPRLHRDASSSRGRSPTPSPTSARSRCSAGCSARPCAARTT